MNIYSNTSKLSRVLNNINNLYKTDDESVETSLIEKTCESINSEEIDYVGTYAFAYCSNLTSVSFPACTTIDNNAFAHCSSLTTVSFPNCKTINDFAFADCSSLITVNFPNCTTIGNKAFQNCDRLMTVSFPVCSFIYGNAFSSCYNLMSVYLMSKSICALNNSNAFYHTKITSSNGSIYVPSSLVASYKTATNWTYFSNRIFAGEG